MSKKIFIAHSMGMCDNALRWAEKLEYEGHDTYVPCRDTAQEPGPNFEGAWENVILSKNFEGIEWCDEVHVIWDLSSLGTIFDMGSAYALSKPIFIIETKRHHWSKFIDENVGKRIL